MDNDETKKLRSEISALATSTFRTRHAIPLLLERERVISLQNLNAAMAELQNIVLRLTAVLSYFVFRRDGTFLEIGLAAVGFVAAFGHGKREQNKEALKLEQRIEQINKEIDWQLVKAQRPTTDPTFEGISS